MSDLHNLPKCAEELWVPSLHKRLKTAKLLNKNDRQKQKVIDYLLKDCPLKDCPLKDCQLKDCPLKGYRLKGYPLKDCPSFSWPDGCHTSINPWIVLLGPSPGAPHPGDDKNADDRKPTAGKPHPTIAKHNNRPKFFEKIRKLGISLIKEYDKDVLVDDPLALVGVMNLDPREQADSNNVVFDPDFVHWALEVSIRRLKPRYIVGLGLKGILNKNENLLCDQISSYIDGPFNPKVPPISENFPCNNKNYSFCAWPLLSSNGHPQHFILFPQHPSRPPMKIPGAWDKAVLEFVNFIKQIDP